MSSSQIDDLLALVEEERIGADEQCIDLLHNNPGEGAFYLARDGRVEHHQPRPQRADCPLDVVVLGLSLWTRWVGEQRYRGGAGSNSRSSSTRFESSK